MLYQRILTAAVLLAFLLPALFAADQAYFVLCTGVLIVAAAWEWGRLSERTQTASLAGAAGMGLACLALGFVPLEAPFLGQLWLSAAVAWTLLAWFALRGGAAVWSAVPSLLRWVCGLFLLLLSWLALVQARGVGINFLLSVMALVWTSDICAYFAGRAWGGRWITRKLAVTISPGKTWEGVAGALAGVAVLAVSWRYADAQVAGLSPSVFSRLSDSWGGWAVVVLAVLVAAGVLGDLLESLFKRAAGVKDSSGLLPGHGGVLDRVDALLPVMPLALCLISP